MAQHKDIEEKKPRISLTLNGALNVTFMMIRLNQVFKSPTEAKILKSGASNRMLGKT